MSGLDEPNGCFCAAMGTAAPCSLCTESDQAEEPAGRSEDDLSLEREVIAAEQLADAILDEEENPDDECLESMGYEGQGSD